MTEATRVLDEAIAAAPDPRLQARAQVEREFVRLETDPSAGTERSRRVADARPAGVRARRRRARRVPRSGRCAPSVAWIAGQVGRADAAWRKAADCARRAGDERELFDVLGWRADRGRARPDPGRRGDRPLRGLSRPRRREPGRRGVDAQPARRPARDARRLRARRPAARRGERDARRARQRRLERLAPRGACVWLLAGRPELAEVPLRERHRSGSRRWATAACWRRRPRCSRRPSTPRAASTRRPSCARRPRRRGATDDIVTQVDLAQRAGEDPRARRTLRRGPGARTRGGRAHRADRLALTSR